LWPAEPHGPRDRISGFASTFVTCNHAPRIDERAATRGSSATKGGEERAEVQRASHASASRTESSSGCGLVSGHSTD